MDDEFVFVSDQSSCRSKVDLNIKGHGSLFKKQGFRVAKSDLDFAKHCVSNDGDICWGCFGKRGVVLFFKQSTDERITS